MPARPLIGRAREVDQARRLLLDDGARLLTLTGPGGVGKTRLALAVAGSVESAFADGVRFVDLSPLRDASMVSSAIGRACGVVHESAAAPLLGLARALKEQRLLLVLDNCEHVLDAAADIGQLLDVCPGLVILATSREPLRLRLEWEFPVAPLPRPAVPSSTVPSPSEVDALTHNAAVALFVQRARAVRPAFVLTPDNARAVAELCVKLDGLPLAIELAARTRFLPPAILLVRLQRRLDLQSAVRDVPERHRTLREAIDWSVTLLSPDQETAFRRLAVFVGGCTLEGAERVCEMDATTVFDLLSALVERNLLISDESDEVRFRMLETVREYALERLEASGDADAVRAAHADFCLSLVDAAEPAMRGAEQRVWLDRLERDIDNLRAGLAWLIARADADALDDAAHLAWSLWHFWWVRGYLGEGRRWGEAILACSPTPDLARARAAWVVGTAALDQGDYAVAPVHIAQALENFRRLDDVRGVARALLAEGWAAPVGGDLQTALAAHRESVALFRQAGDDQGAILALAGLANTMTLAGDLDAAREHNEQALALARQCGDSHSQAQVLEALGLVALQRGDLDAAAASFRSSVPVCISVGSVELLCYCLVGEAGVAARNGAHERAAQLLGAAEGLRERADLGVWPVRQGLQQRLAESVRERLGTSFEAAWSAGRGLSLQAAAQLALAVEGHETPRPVAAESNGSESVATLSPREVEVAGLIAQGKTSKEIADALVITERTADTHAAHIREKLGLRSRAEIAAWAVRHLR